MQLIILTLERSGIVLERSLKNSSRKTIRRSVEPAELKEDLSCSDAIFSNLDIADPTDDEPHNATGREAHASSLSMP